MPAGKSYIGERFGHLVIEAEWVVTSKLGYRSKRCRARCDCGVVAEYTRGSLSGGRTTHCARCPLKPKRPKFHRPTRARWKSLVKHYECVPAWKSYESFLSDIGEIPHQMTIMPARHDRPVGPNNYRFTKTANGHGTLGDGLWSCGRPITRAEAAKLLGLSRQRVHKMVQSERELKTLKERLRAIEKSPPDAAEATG